MESLSSFPYKRNYQSYQEEKTSRSNGSKAAENASKKQKQFSYVEPSEEELKAQFTSSYVKLQKLQIKSEKLNLVKSVRKNISSKAIRDLRYSQATIAPTIKTGQKLDELATRIYEKGWDKNYPLHIVAMPDGEFTSLDNRRLYVLKKILESNPHKDLDVNVILDFHPDRIDGETHGQITSNVDQWASETDRDMVDKELNALIREMKIFPDSYGLGVVARMHSIESTRRKYLQNYNYVTADFLKKNMYGFSQDPVIWDSKKQQHYLMNARLLQDR